MYLASSFAFLLQELAVTMTAPSFQNFTLLVTGWVFASRRTVTGMLLAAGVAEQRHHSAFHRLFSAVARASFHAADLVPPVFESEKRGETPPGLSHSP